MSFLARFGTLALTTTMVSTAFACPIRDLNGACVELQAPTEPTTVVFWSVDCARCGKEISELEKTGHRLVIINTDDTSRAARLRPAIRVLGLQSPVVADPVGSVRARLAVEKEQQRVVLRPSGDRKRLVVAR